MKRSNDQHIQNLDQALDREAYGTMILVPEPGTKSGFRVISAPNVYLLLLKIIFAWKPIIPRQNALRYLLTGLLVDLGLFKPKPEPEPQNDLGPDDLPF